MQAKRGRDVGKVVLESGPGHLVEPRPFTAVALPRISTHAVQTPDPGFVDQVLAGGEHPAFSGGQVLGRVERKGDRPSFVLSDSTDSAMRRPRGKSVRSVFNETEVIVSDEVEQRGH